MIAFLIWIVGLILTIKACLEIWKLPVDEQRSCWPSLYCLLQAGLVFSFTTSSLRISWPIG